MTALDISGLPDQRPERIGARAAARILGKTLRSVQDMAASGKIPGAAKLGGTWTFDEARLRLWIREREDEACQTIYTGAARSGGRASRSTAGTIDAAYARLLRL